MSQSPEGLAPWAHPKTQEWLEALFEKSELIREFERLVDAPNEPLSAGQLRLLTALLIILGHDKIWPEEQRPRFEKLVTRVNALYRDILAQRKIPQTMQAHQKQTIVNSEWEVEIEMMRRRAGLSKRVTKIDKPKSWLRFWN